MAGRLRIFPLLLRSSRCASRFVKRSPKAVISVVCFSAVSMLTHKVHNDSKWNRVLMSSSDADDSSLSQPESELRDYKIFKAYATYEFDDYVYMTPSGFVRSCLNAREIVASKQLYLPPEKREEILKNAHRIKPSPTLFSSLGENGIISFAEYMFLRSILTHPQGNLDIAFRMFDRNTNGEIDIEEFKKITKSLSKSISYIKETSVKKHNPANTTLLRLFFGKSGDKKLHYEDFLRFASNLKSEILLMEFNHISANQKTISPLDLGHSLLRYTNTDSKSASLGLSKIRESDELANQSVTFEDYKALFDLLFVLDDFASALNMFLISHRAISRDEFQRATRAVTGKFLNPVVLDTIFTLFDSDGDGHLSFHEFIDTIRARGSRVASQKEPSFRFAYWPRYVARLIRFRPVYKREFLGWRFESEHAYMLPDDKPGEYREEKFLPVWRFSESPPWNIANRVSEFLYPDVSWCVIHPDGKQEEMKLKPLPRDQQLIFKGDRVRVLVGPDKGKVGIISSIVKLRRQVYIEGLNYEIKKTRHQNVLKREELPLDMDTEIALLDPVDNEPCQCTWRYDKKGARVRVSLRSGHIVPLPAAASILDDLTDPGAAVAGSKDTLEADVISVTFDPSDPTCKVSFEDDVQSRLGLMSTRKRLPTYWY